MKKHKQAVCLGCSRHCTADTIHCKYGRAYFAKLGDHNPEEGMSQQAEHRVKHTHKWEKNVAQGGVMWNLLSVSRRVRKALRSGSISETQLLSSLNESEKAQLLDILHKVNEYLEQRKDFSEPD